MRDNEKFPRSTLVMRNFLAMGLTLLMAFISLSAIFVNISESNTIEQVQKQILKSMDLSSQRIDQYMNLLNERSLELMVDKELCAWFASLKEDGRQAYALVENSISMKLLSAFYNIDYVASAHILYEDYTFTVSTRGWLDYKAVRRSETWEEILSSQGSIVWFPPDYERKLGDTEQGKGYILLGRMLNMTDLETMDRIFDKDESKPVLIVCLNPDFFSDTMLSCVEFEEAEHILLDKEADRFEGNSGNRSLDRSRIQGTGGYWSDGTMLYFYVKSDATDWYHVVYFPKSILVKNAIDEMKTATVPLIGALLLLMLGMAILFSYVLSLPIQKMVTGMKHIENGDLDYRIVNRGAAREISYLIDRMNLMSSSLQKLIQEKYQAKLREKEAEIASLTIQFNPHYLYNTLNSIYWVAIQGDVGEVATMIRMLAQMMRYTSDNHQEQTLLRDDLKWMEQYVYLMKARYGELFEVKWDVEEALLDCRVPKLFLQPLVENSIIHGFCGIETGGVIAVRGYEAGEFLEFTVCDNGCGMDREQIETCIDRSSSSIGLKNVQHRIKLICGEECGLRIFSEKNIGTTVTVRIAKNNSIK